MFAWDPRKAASNVRKHGIGFSEASTVFLDPLAMTFPDPDHSVGEARFITFGSSSGGRILVVAHIEVGDQVRLISARKATKSEAHGYTKGS